MPSSKFDWHADEEQEWEALQPLPEGGEPAQPRRLGRLVYLIVAAIIFAAALFFFLNRRVNKAVTQAEQEVLAAHNLLVSAVQDNDYELYLSLLADRPPGWQVDQQKMLRSELFWGRTSLGLEPAAPEKIEQESIEIELVPELNQATVAHVRPFVAASAESTSSTVELERTFSYERDEQGWHMTSLKEKDFFWGEWQRDAGDLLTLVYPQRDTPTAQRLAPALDELVAGLCAEPRLNCPADFHLELKLDRDERALLRLNEGYYSLGIPVRSGKGNLTLPSPSLIGRPLDEAGYQALLQGYASLLGAVLINNFAVQEQNVDQQLIAELLAERDFALPPHPQPMLPWPADVVLPVGLSAIPHDILMLCSGGNTQRLLRFNTDKAVWSNEWLFRIIGTSGAATNFPGPTLHRLPDYNGALVSFASDEDAQQWQTYLWQNGQEQLWLEHEQAPDFLPPRFFFPFQDKKSVMKGYYLSFDNNSAKLEPWWIDAEACREGACQRNAVDGAPLWSPNGQRTLLVNMASLEQLELHLGDKEGRSTENLGEGFPISWIDNDHFAFLRQQIPGATDPTQMGIWKELVIGTIGSRGALNTEVVIDTLDLKSGIATERAGLQLGIVTAAPYKDGWLVATRELGPDFRTGSYLFFYRPQSGELSVIMENEMEMILPPLMLDMGGPFLAVSALRRGSFIVRFINPDDGQEIYRTNSFPVDWSADGQWLLFVQERQLMVAAPVLDLEWTIKHNLPDCYAAVWNEREVD